MITTFDSAQINWNQWKCVRIKCSWICFLRTMWMKFENSKDEKSSETNCHKTELNLQKKREKKWNFKRKVKCIPIKKWIVGDMRECVRVCLYVCRSSRQVICLRNMRIITIGNMRPRAMHRPKCRYLRQCYSIMSIYVCARVWWALNTSNAVPWITILLMFILSISHICRECIHAQRFILYCAPTISKMKHDIYRENERDDDITSSRGLKCRCHTYHTTTDNLMY